MLDKNNKEIKTGDIVRISGAYFKNDNGLYYVESSPGDPSWLGSNHSLKKITKNGKISTAKYNICFWPISITVSNWEKKILAKEHNAKYAEIEVVSGIDKTEIINHFTASANALDSQIEYALYNYGEENECYKLPVRVKNFFLDVADRLIEE